MNSLVLNLQIKAPQSVDSSTLVPSNSIMTFLPWAAIIAIFCFLIIRHQNKKKKETQKMPFAHKKDNKIVTIGGIDGVFFIILGVILLVVGAGKGIINLIGIGVVGIILGVISKIKRINEDRQWRKEEEENARKRSELEQRAAAGDPDAKKELIEMGTETKQWYINAVGNLPDDAETRAFEIIRNAIVRHGGSCDFTATAAPPSENHHNFFNVWKKWFETSKKENIWLTFVSGHHQTYTDLNGREQSGDICAIEFYLFLKMLPETVSIIANEAEQEIKGYFSSKGLSLRK